MVTRITTIAAEKGGVGKTTTTINVGAGMIHALRAAASTNTRVLVIDCDVQGHLTDQIAKRNNFNTTDSLYSVITAPRDSSPGILMDCLVQSPDDPDLYLLPATSELYVAANLLAGVAGAPFRLRDALHPIKDHFAVILIDTGPSFGLLTEMAVLAATDVLIPTEPRYLETLGLHNAINNINRIRDGWHHDVLRIIGVIVTRLDRRITGHNEMLKSLQSHPELGPLLISVIPQNEAVSYSHHAQLNIFDYDPKSAAAIAYARLVDRLVPLIAAGVAR